MKTMATSAFNEIYTGFELTISAYSENPTATVKLNGETKTYKVVPYDTEAGEDGIYFDFKDGEEVGHIELPTVRGNTVTNGKYPTVEVEFDKRSRTKFVMSFNSQVEGVEAVAWYVWAKISN